MEKEILEKLAGFPSCFHTFAFVQKLGNERKEKILAKIVSERETSGFHSAIEDEMALNFISYISFSVGNFEDALKYNSTVLEKNEHNINAIVSKARYHLYESEFADSHAQCALLDTLKDNELEMLCSKAEQAYVCSRLGMEMYKEAENLFTEAIKEGEGKVVPDYEICMWKFGLALTMRRQLNFTNLHTENIDYFGSKPQRCNRILELFIDIIKMDGEGLDIHKARSFVQIGEILALLRYHNAIFKTELFDFLPGIDIESKVAACYEKGLSLQQDDVFVIERFAKYCRLSGQVDQSIALCRRALRIRETSVCHHYLALALKKKLEIAKIEQNSNKGTQNRPKPHHVRDLRLEMDTCQTTQAGKDASNTIRRLDSGIFSMEEQTLPADTDTIIDNGEPNANPIAESVVAGQMAEVSHNINLTCQSQASSSDQPFDQGYENTNVRPKTGDYSKQFNETDCRDNSNDWQVVTKRAGRRQNRVKHSGDIARSKQYHSMGGGEYYPNVSNSRGHGDMTRGTRRHHDSYKERHNWHQNKGGHQTKSGGEFTAESSSSSREYVFSKEERALSKLIKSPKKPIHLPENQIGEIMFHLNRAVELSENMSALYDKALVLRAARRHTEALDILKAMFRNKACSLVHLTNAYEQSALCLQDQLETDTIRDNLDKEKINTDLKQYLLKSIEIACNLITKQPSLKNCWVSFPTLKSLLEEKPDTKSTRKELGRLHRMVQDYNGAIGWFKQVLEMEIDDSGKASAHMDIVQNCLKAEDYDEAILHLDMVQSLTNCRILIDEELYFEAHIEGGLKSFSTGEMEMARLRLKNALDYKRRDDHDKINDGVEVSEHEESIQQEWFDVFILCDSRSETIGRNMWHLFHSLGLEATLNDDCAAPYLPRIDGLSKVIERSTHCAVVLGNDMNELRFVKMLTNIVKMVQEDRSYGNVVVVKQHETVHVDTMFRGFTSIICQEVDSFSEDHKPWIKQLLWMLASGSEYVQA